MPIQCSAVLGHSSYIQQSQDFCAQGYTCCIVNVFSPRLFIWIYSTYAWSFLSSVLTRYLQVASNPEIDLGDDDDPIKVDIMLRTMYDDDTVYGLNIDFYDANLTKTFLDYYILGDKYDVPVLRHKAKDMFISEIKGNLYLRDDLPIWTSESFDNPAKGIAMVLGPSAITFGDRSIQEDTLNWCVDYLHDLLWHRTFRKLLGKGQMFSTEFAGRLFLMKARDDGVEFGCDIDNVDNDAYDHSSADEDTIQVEHETESEAEQHEDDDDDQSDDDDEQDDNGESIIDDEASSDDDSTQVREYEVEEELGSKE